METLYLRDSLHPPAAYGAAGRSHEPAPATTGASLRTIRGAMLTVGLRIDGASVAYGRSRRRPMPALGAARRAPRSWRSNPLLLSSITRCRLADSVAG